MPKAKKQPELHSPIHIPIQLVNAHRKANGLELIPVHNRNTPLFDYRQARKSLNTDIKALKKEIWRARLLKVQAYIAYRLTK